MNRTMDLHNVHGVNGMGSIHRVYSQRSCVFTQAMERLDQFEPAVMHAAAHDVQSYALAYVEHYRGNVAQLEREREFLLAALAQAWQQEKYTAVVRLMTGLTYLAGRLGNDAQGQRLLLWGIDACRHTHDRYHLATFLHRYSELLWSHGHYTQARQAWAESRTIADEPGRSACLWEPLFSLVYIADMLGAYAAVQRFTDAILHAQDIEDADSIASARFLRAFFARFAGERDSAYEDLSVCLQSLSARDAVLSIYQQFFAAEVRTELARVEGNYALARTYTETTISCAQSFSDPYIIAILLVDQIIFAHQRGMLNEAYASIQYLAKLTGYMAAPHLHKVTLYFLRQLPETEQEHFAEYNIASSSQHVASVTPLPATSHVLSQRELEILRLVATGSSNQEIAARLVISVGTTKKHLEHIYEKLDAHSRTQAIAGARALGVLS
jgi:DNA-binding CsgD family transcriptional regulator